MKLHCLGNGVSLLSIQIEIHERQSFEYKNITQERTMTMLQRKKNTVLVSYLIVVSLLGPLIFWLSNHETRQNPKLFGLNNNKKVDPVKSRTSLGKQILVTADNSPDKQAGVQAFASAQFAVAISKFNSSLQINRNDPEARIYLNNATAAANGNVVKLAVSVPIGGNLNIAREILRGVAQAQNEVNNSGGIGGKLVQVEIANDDNDPEIAKQIATEFVKDQSILAVIGHNSSEASIAAAPVYQQGGLVMISPSSVARNLSGIGSYIFRTTPSTRAIAEPLARYAVNYAHKTKIAICSASKTEASQSFKEEFTWAIFEHGGKVTNTACDFSSAKFNPSDIPSQAISDGADALLIAPSLYNTNQAIELIRANKKRLPLLGNQTMYGIETLRQGQVDANGMVLAATWHPQAIPGSSFPTNARKLWGGSGSWRTAMAYDATEAVFTGLKSGLSREQLQKTLSNSGFSFNGATGPIQFLPSGDRQGKGLLIKIQPGKDSGTGYDFVSFQP